MGLSDAVTKQQFPVDANALYAAALAVLEPSGFQIARQDTLTMRINAKAGMSLWSYGEDVLVRVEATPGGSILEVSSSLKVGMNLSGAPQNTKNAERIIGAVSAFLQSGAKPGRPRSAASVRAAASAAARAAPSNGASLGQWALAAFIVIIALVGMIARA